MVSNHHPVPSIIDYSSFIITIHQLIQLSLIYLKTSLLLSGESLPKVIMGPPDLGEWVCMNLMPHLGVP